MNARCVLDSQSRLAAPQEAPGVDKPKDKLQYCRECNGYKAPRAHHCKEWCVLQVRFGIDSCALTLSCSCFAASAAARCLIITGTSFTHHASTSHRLKKTRNHLFSPWINSCVGNDNRLAFVSFATLVPIGKTLRLKTRPVVFLPAHFSPLARLHILGLCLLVVSDPVLCRSHESPPLASALSQTWRAALVLCVESPGNSPIELNLFSPLFPFSARSVRGFVFILLGAALAIGVTLGVGMLAGIQWRSILRNKTEVENWITKKAKRRERSEPFVFPYDMGWKKNVQCV